MAAMAHEAPETETGGPAVFDPSPAMRWLLATLSFCAGAIHLVMVPQHAQESLRIGVAFAAAGWFQIAFGAVMLTRPRRGFVWTAIAVNLLFVATWLLSRTVGLPPWSGDGGVEDMASVDLWCAVLEVAVVVGAVMVLLSPDALRRWKRPALVAAAVVPFGLLVATTAVLASPSTASHAHGDDDHEHTAVASTAHDHAAAAVAAEPSTVHDHAAVASPAVVVPTTVHDHTAVASAPVPVPTAVHEHDGSATRSTVAAHQHAESDITYAELPPDTKAEVDDVIAAWATKYATGADAAADGWMRATKSLYGIGAHYVRRSGLFVPSAAEFDPMQPNILLFDGDGPDAKFAGLSYVVKGVPDGFTGDYDSWHYHTSVCLAQGTVVSLIEEGSPVWLSEGDCKARGGNVLPLAGGDEMMHLWIGPGYIDTGPIMSHDHPLLLDGYHPKRDG
jgi:hypothetical protein